MLTNYYPEAYLDFSLEENERKMKSALRRARADFGKDYPLIIGGERIFTEEKMDSLNPSKFSEILGHTSIAGLDLAERAICEAERAFKSWRNVSPALRANYLFQGAAILRRRKFEFSAWLVLEAGKNWAEADGETAEAIDFLEYYGRRMLAMANGVEITPLPGENNECKYIPLGVGVIIAPWNFPLAILAGMTAAAVVTGNTVVMKPASTTTVIAAKFMEIWEEIGLPVGVVNFLPCAGGQVGDFLVKHQKTRFINFTGSKEIGLRINRFASDITPGQIWIKRVVAEMGGKDGIIVDKSADLESAAEGLVASAFGFQGQKCSASSRGIIHEAVYDEFVELIREKTEKLTIGEAEENKNLGPVVDEKAFRKILEYIEIGKAEGKVVAGGRQVLSGGYFIRPTVIKDILPEHRLAREEIFGPVLALIKAKDLDEALEIGNDTEYGLTGAIYAMDRKVIERAKQEFHVGNLYINRKCTGALVGVNPFGGFNMSGTDSKAGGPEYLNMFMQLKSITEKY